MNDQKKMSTREIVAIVFSSATVLGAIVYWWIQIDGVLAMLKLANGG
jgi:hypothetical protein